MQRYSTGSKLLDEPDDFNARELALKVKISRENANSRRFSASNFKSFRENRRSFGSNITISSTVSSPGYTVRDEINPSTYSFTNALKALQARTAREYLSPDNGGLSLSSKWNDAEKYICNPLSGQVPLQCLSSKALISENPSQRLTRSRITLSAPLIFQNHHFQTKSSTIQSQNQVRIVAIQEDKRSTKRDVGTQIKPGSEISITAPNPSIQENSTKPSDQEETRASLVTPKILKSEAMVEQKERGDRRKRKKVMMTTTAICSHKGKGCLSFIRIWRHKTKNQNNNNATYLCHLNASFQQ